MMEFGWKRIWQLYGWKALCSPKNKLFYFSIIVTTIISVSLIIMDWYGCNLVYSLIDKTIETGISILPTLLGFNLGSYALIIGFLSNENLLNALTEKQGTNTKTDLERISSVFAINIITQAFTLLAAFLLRAFIVINEKLVLPSTIKDFFYAKFWLMPVNALVLIFILFFTIYSIALVIQSAINIFDFSQLFNYFSTKGKEGHDNN